MDEVLDEAVCTAHDMPNVESLQKVPRHVNQWYHWQHLQYDLVDLPLYHDDRLHVIQYPSKTLSYLHHTLIHPAIRCINTEKK